MLQSFPYPLIPWLLIPPLGSAILLRLFGKRFSPRWVGAIGSGAVFLSFAIALYIGWDLFQLVPGYRRLVADLFPWISLAGVEIPFRLVVDPLSYVMVLVVTGIGFLIHLYSSEYMEHDPRIAEFFSYLNFFIVSMLILVLAGNLPLMFVGWEGVGLCSYLLIGFWYQHLPNAQAGRKAFVVNRIGDAGFLIGIFLLQATIRTTDFAGIHNLLVVQKIYIPVEVTRAIALCLFLGAVGKSAQIPLYVWLPDAMAGPTPVSALIHAATMVTAGVYMVCRLFPLYLASPTAMELIAWTGALTALLAGLIATAQNDIKRVLAYSTVSQLGYMFLATGVGAFSYAIFHLVTHAFFKALLFLGAGSVIHAMEHAHAAHDPQDIRTMGGLRRYLPWTTLTFSIGTLAIAGVPFLSGFFSKDQILWNALSSNYGSPSLFFVGLFTALLTAFYMTRLLILVFFGEFRGNPQAISHLHEPGVRILLPLILLAVGSVVSGYLGIPEEFHLPRPFFEFLAPLFVGVWFEESHYVYLGRVEITALKATGLSILTALSGIILAYLLYLRSPGLRATLKDRLAPVVTLLRHKFFVDELYDLLIVRPLVGVSDRILYRGVERRFIDLIVEGTGRAMRGFASFLQLLQGGNLALYLSLFALGGLLFILFMERM
jgi:NADH-quinone oxidoreductase subunit L